MKHTPPRVAIATLGCKLNRADTDALLDAFLSRGWVEAPFQGDADVYVINTCTVTASTDHQCRQLIRRALAKKSERPGVRVAVTGCYPQTAADELMRMTPGVDFIAGNAEKERLAEWVDAAADGPVIRVGDIAAEKSMRTRPFVRRSGLTRALLRIQDGCDARCAYCIVPHARGPSRSEPPELVLKQARVFAANGHREIVLTGIHIGAWGKDLQPPAQLPHLVREICAAVPDCRTRLSSLDPGELTPELLAAVDECPTVCRHFHVSLQSGADASLRRMRRPYTADAAGERIRSLSTHFPDAAIGADVIVGFPGETESDFDRTLQFIDALPLAYLHVFRYSPRRGTPAADMEGQVGDEEKKLRARRLAEIRSRKIAAFRRRFIGREMDVLLEHRRVGASLVGTTENYLRVRLSGPDEWMGRVVRARLTSAEADGLAGELVDGCFESGVSGDR